MHYEVGGKRALLTRKCGEKQGQKYICSLNHVDSHFAGKLVREIDEDEIDRFVAQRRQAGASIFSINRSLGLLRQAFRLAVEKKKLSAEAVPKIRIDAKSEKQKRRKGFLEYDDFVRLRDALPERLKVVLTLGFYTGMRLGEIKNLKWSGVNLNREEIRLEADETKNGEPRTIPLLKELPTMLKMLCNEGPKPKYVFGGDRPLGNFRKTWNGTCVKVGLGEFVELPNGRKKYKGLIFHDLRRSAVRFLIDSDIPEGQIMEIVGHQTRSMFDRYAIKSAKTLREAKRKAESHLDELISQRPVKETQAESTGTEMPTQLIQ
jgi:integrase